MNHSIHLTSTGRDNTAEYTTNFSNPIKLHGIKWNLSLSKLSTYYSWWNITSENNVFKYFNGSVDRTLTLETGVYTVQTLIQHIHDKMSSLGDHTLVEGKPTYSLDMHLDLSDGDVSLLLSESYTVDF